MEHGNSRFRVFVIIAEDGWLTMERDRLEGAVVN